MKPIGRRQLLASGGAGMRSQMPFPVLQGLFDGLRRKGLQWYWKGDFVRELTDTAIEEHLRHAANTPSELSLTHLYPIDRAVHSGRRGRDPLARAFIPTTLAAATSTSYRTMRERGASRRATERTLTDW